MLRRGRHINVQATAVGRRRKTLSRWKAKAPSGRPAAAESETICTNGSTLSYHLPSRNTILKPPNSLTANISVSQQDARCWEMVIVVPKFYLSVHIGIYNTSGFARFARFTHLACFARFSSSERGFRSLRSLNHMGVMR